MEKKADMPAWVQSSAVSELSAALLPAIIAVPIDGTGRSFPVTSCSPALAASPPIVLTSLLGLITSFSLFE